MPTVLIADDNADGRELLRDHLEAWGFEVLEARDGQEALAAAARYRPDAILLDVQMPRLDGFAVLHKLREDRRLSDTPALAVTACAWNGTRDRALQAGFIACFAKPVDFRALRDELERLLPAAPSFRAAAKGVA
jgi:CheY-like chemotaxis protein